MVFAGHVRPNNLQFELLFAVMLRLREVFLYSMMYFSSRLQIDKVVIPAIAYGGAVRGPHTQAEKVMQVVDFSYMTPQKIPAKQDYMSAPGAPLKPTLNPTP